MLLYVGTGKDALGVSTTGWLYGNFSQLKLQAEAAVFVIVLIAVATFVILKTIGRFVPLRRDAKTLEIGDAAAHGPSGS